MSSGHSYRRQWAYKAAAVLLSVSALVAIASCSSLREHIAMKDAAKAYKSQKFTLAAKDFETALAINPNRAENWKYLGYTYWSLVEPGSKQPIDQQYTDKALAAFQKYLSMVGKDDKVQNYMINLYISQNRLDQGIKFYEAQLEIYPKDVRIMQTLSTMYAKENNFPKALEYSVMKAKEKPGDISGWLFIGALCWNRSYNAVDPDEERGSISDQGIAALKRAIAINTNNFNAHLFLNLLYRQKSILAKNAAGKERNRSKKRALLAKSDDFLNMANQERDTAIAIRHGNGSSGPSNRKPGAVTSPASDNN